MAKDVINLITVKRRTYPRSSEWTVNTVRCTLIRGSLGQPHRGYVKMEAEIGVMRPQAQELPGREPEAGRGME